MKVAFIVSGLSHYRVNFHCSVKDRLAQAGVQYDLFVAAAKATEKGKGDMATLPWQRNIRSVSFGDNAGEVVAQFLPLSALSYDLLVVIQENRYLINYVLSLTRRLLGIKLAYFGHGRNFQSRNPEGKAERFKRFWATKVDWWFGYTDETRRHIESLGFPPECITVFNNAVDTSTVRAAVADVTPERLAARGAELGLTGDHVGVFVGGLYADKRLTFLVDAAERVRARVPNFELIVVGGGEQLSLMHELAADRPWLKVTGPRFGADKVELMMLGQLFLMPGLVGLAIVDAGAAGLPTVTTTFPWHSPEIAYLENGVNGVIVADWQDTQAYADAVSALLEDRVLLTEMRTAAMAMAEERTIETMAHRFAEGVLKVLKAR